MKNEKQQFKNKVLNIIKKNKIELGNKKVRVYKYRGGLEVRIYNKPMMMANQKRSFREYKEKTKLINDGQRHGSYGIFERNITTYIYFNEYVVGNKEELAFHLDMLKN